MFPTRAMPGTGRQPLPQSAKSAWHATCGHARLHQHRVAKFLKTARAGRRPHHHCETGPAHACS
eukprot:8877057-Pyramimonas_sp.AAC.1